MEVGNERIYIIVKTSYLFVNDNARLVIRELLF